MRKTNKRGFTIVELVIVIAVIAILAAVLIPTFTNLVKKANVTADTQLVRNLNTALKLDNTKHETMYDALKAVDENGGFDVAKINASVADNEILWDSVNDCFVYLNDGEITYIPNSKEKEVSEKVDYWKISDKTEDWSGDYSVYYTGKAPEDRTITTTVGFDVGTTTGITSVIYNGSSAGQRVKIRTNDVSTVITANAPNDTVSFYGVGTLGAGSKFANMSAHIYGDFSGNIAQGRVVYHVLNSDKIIIAENTGVTIGFSDDAKASGYHVDIRYPSTIEYYYIQLTTNDGTEVRKTKVSVDSISGQATIVETKDSSGNVVEVPAFVSQNIAKTNEIVETRGTVDPEAASVGLQYFAGGQGTEQDPYVIANADQWKALCNLCYSDSTYTQTEGKSFVVTSDINVSDFATKYYDNSNACIKYFAGHIDFQNHKIYGFNVENGEEGSLFVYVGGNSAVIENVTMETTTINYSSGTVWAFSLTCDLYGNVTIKNANIVGSASGINTNNNGLFAEYVGYGNGGYGSTYDYIFENCTNYANLTGIKLTAAFVGAGGFGNGGYIKFMNCKNYGTIISTGDSAAMLISNCSYFVPKWGNKTVIIVEACQNFSTIVGIKAQYSTLLMNPNTGDQVFYTQNATLNGVELSNNGSFMGLQYGQNLINNTLETSLTGSKPVQISTETLTTENNVFVLNEVENAVRYELAFSFSAANRNGGGAGYTLIFTNSLPNDIMVGTWITKAEAEATGKDIVAHNDYNMTYYTCDGKYVYYEDGAAFLHDNRDVFVSFIAYGGNDTVLSIATYQYAK